MLGVLSGVLSKVFISWPANNEVKNAVMGRMMANGSPMSEYVAAMESTPVSGVAMRMIPWRLWRHPPCAAPWQLVLLRMSIKVVVHQTVRRRIPNGNCGRRDSGYILRLV